MNKLAIARFLKKELNLTNYKPHSHGAIGFTRKNDPYELNIDFHHGKSWLKDLDEIVHCIWRFEHPELKSTIYELVPNCKKEMTFLTATQPIKFNPIIEIRSLQELKSHVQKIAQLIHVSEETVARQSDIWNLYVDMESEYNESNEMISGSFSNLLAVEPFFKKLVILALVGSPYFERYLSEVWAFLYSESEADDPYEWDIAENWESICEKLRLIHSENVEKYKDRQFLAYNNFLERTAED